MEINFIIWEKRPLKIKFVNNSIEYLTVQLIIALDEIFRSVVRHAKLLVSLCLSNLMDRLSWFLTLKIPARVDVWPMSRPWPVHHAECLNHAIQQHRMHNTDAAYCYRRSGVACVSMDTRVESQAEMDKPIKLPLDSRRSWAQAHQKRIHQEI